MSSQVPSSPDNFSDLDQEVSQVAETIQSVAKQFEAIEKAIESRLSQVQQTIKVTQAAATKAKLEQEAQALNQQMEALRITLANELLPMTVLQGVKELFWQIVRFGGLGFVLGWLLRSMGH